VPPCIPGRIGRIFSARGAALDALRAARPPDLLARRGVLLIILKSNIFDRVKAIKRSTQYWTATRSKATACANRAHQQVYYPEDSKKLIFHNWTIIFLKIVNLLYLRRKVQKRHFILA
jgi:hypothetical protein